MGTAGDTTTTASYQGNIECIPDKSNSSVEISVLGFIIICVLCITFGSCATACLAWSVLSHGEFHIFGVRFKKGDRLVALGEFFLRSQHYFRLPDDSPEKGVEFPSSEPQQFGVSVCSRQ